MHRRLLVSPGVGIRLNHRLTPLTAVVTQNLQKRIIRCNHTPTTSPSLSSASSPTRDGAHSLLAALATRFSEDGCNDIEDTFIKATNQLCLSGYPRAAAALILVALGMPPKLTSKEKFGRSLAAISNSLKHSRASVANPVPLLLAALKGFAVLATPRTLNPDSAPSGNWTDLASLAMSLCTSCLGPPGSHRSSSPLYSAEVATALLDVCAACAVAPAAPLWSDLGFRHHRFANSTAEIRLPLNHGIALARRRPIALEKSTAHFRDATSPPLLGTQLPLSVGAYLWQARGGVWLAHNEYMPPPKVLERRQRLSDSIEKQYSYFTERRDTDVPVDVTSWLFSATEAALPSPATSSQQSVRLGPVGQHPAVDVPTNTSDSMRFVAALWRELTGRIVYVDAVSERARTPSSDFLTAAFRLCNRGSDLAHLRALAKSDGVDITGPALVIAVRQAVRYGDIMLAHSFIEDASLIALAASSLKEPRTTSSTSDTDSDGMLSHVLRGGGLPDAAVDLLVAESTRGEMPTGLPLRLVDSSAPRAIAIRAAYCALVQACAARPAHIQAVMAYYAMLQAGISPR